MSTSTTTASIPSSSAAAMTTDLRHYYRFMMASMTAMYPTTPATTTQKSANQRTNEITASSPTSAMMMFYMMMISTHIRKAGIALQNKGNKCFHVRRHSWELTANVQILIGLKTRDGIREEYKNCGKVYSIACVMSISCWLQILPKPYGFYQIPQTPPRRIYNNRFKTLKLRTNWEQLLH
ncbi:hypothetical protein GQX74_011981 [Glossina fuscipes]|nr:hypothetical protein GQX74_011981 [Glossina fuscipes]